MIELKKSTITKAAGIVALLTLLSRFVGLYRESLFASTFGPGDLLDAYNVAFRIPDLFFNLLVLGTLSVAFIPVFTEYLYRDETEANMIASTIINAAFIGMTIVMLVVFLFVPHIAAIIAPGFHGQKLANTILLTKFFLISPIIFTVSSVFSSILNARKRFFLASLAPVLYNLGIIIGVKFLYPIYGIYGLAYGVLIGAMAHALIQVPGIVSAGFTYSPSLRVGHPAVKKIAALFVPRIMGMDLGQVSMFIVSFIGSTLSSGTISIFTFANNLQMVPVGVFATSFAIASFPSLAEKFVTNEHKEFSDILLDSILNILFYVIPISLFMIILRAQIVRFLFGHGHFNWTDTYLTANALGIFAISIFAQGLVPLFARSFYAMHDTITPVITGTIAIVVDGFASYFLKGYGVIGLAGGFSIASIVNVLLLGIFLYPKLIEFDTTHLLGEGAKILLSTGVAGIISYELLHFLVMYFPLTDTFNVIIQGGVAGLFGVLVFILTAYLLRLKQVQLLRRFLKQI